MVTTERRRAPRTRLTDLVYIGMGTDNGGVVLDVSDGGLSFHAVASVQQASPIHFSLSVQGNRRIQGIAEVAWNSGAGKCAGLRFVHLPEEVREQIQIWSKQPRLNLPVAGQSPQSAETKPAPPSLIDLAPVEASQPAADNTFLSAVLPDLVSSPEIIAGTSPELVAETEEAALALKPPEHAVPKPQINPLSMFPPEPTRESEAATAATRYAVPSRYGLVAIVVTVVLASIMAITGLSYAYLHGTGKSLLHFADKIRDWF